MKIFSKFKDYYDHIQAFGQGDDVRYIRNTETYCSPDRPYHDGWFKVQRDAEGIDRMTEPYDMKMPLGSSGGNWVRIHFCGKIYYMLKVEQMTSRHGIIPAEMFYNADKYEKYVNDNVLPSYDYYNLKHRLKTLRSNGEVDTHNINQKLGHPVIMVKYAWYGLYNIYNPRLYEIEFQKVVDPYTAYMELDMFISGVLGKTGGEMVKISDKDKIDKHGFDMKYGFRTRPKQSA